ncbi:MAG: LssY C-terminal domain-containing protein [Anaerolineae bacterium]|nr:LssY C-terminal domain-containing protein [Phycisphaerae bacterium]
MKRKRRAIIIFLSVLLLYLGVAYVLAPFLWQRRERHHPALTDAPTITRTGDGIPGDPVDVALVGTEEQIHRAMLTAKWYPANPITLASSLRIAVDVVISRPFDEAPVSPLFLFGRKEDLAFERPVGDNPRERHHVRFWKSDKLDKDGRPLWFGSATFDTHVGFSHDTGQITHHIAPEVDHDRDLLLNNLNAAGVLSSIDWIDGFQKDKSGLNGGGDPWRTDGRLGVGVIQISQNH